ncbi:MAG: UDP-N-acetylglucosamine 2-epimerase (non-hydrolyzing) [Sphingomonas sp.]
MAPTVTHVVGNRPHFMKLAPIVAGLERRGIASEVLHTGQHWDDSLSGQFVREFGIAIAEGFEIEPGGHGVQTASMMRRLERYWTALPRLPRIVLVYGDTNSTLAAALVAAKLDIAVGHVEGGVRADFLEAMMPEEINRKLVDDLSRWIYTPTDRCAAALRAEGFAEDRIVNSGDVMFDRLLATAAETPSAIAERAPGFAFATVHRAENTDDGARLFAIFDALAALAERVEVVLAVHPRTEKLLAQSGRLAGYARTIACVPPLNHVDTVALVGRAAFVISDSGGLPKEAAFLGKRSVLLRRQAIWTELVDQGFALLADPARPGAIAEAAAQMLAMPPPERAIEGFGDGRAADAIAAHLAGKLG